MNIKSIIYWKVVYPIIIIFDKLQGLDLLPKIMPEDVGLDPERVFMSCPSSTRFLKIVLKDFNISSQDSILDIGCGKGSAMRTMLKFPFIKVDGLEISDYIANIATKNFKKLNSNRSKIFNCDATQFKNFDAYNFVYLYNPFPSFVMSEVLECLVQSIHKSERELVIIYMNPICDNVIVNTGVFARAGIYFRRGSWITTYTNRTGDQSVLSGNKRMHKSVEGSALDNALDVYLKNYIHSN